MFKIIEWVADAWQTVRTSVQHQYVTFKDKLKNLEVQHKHGTASWAARRGETFYDIDAPKTNANVYIATRAISDAVKGISANIVEVDTVGGIDRWIDDNDHPANDIINKPNPEHTWSDIIDYITKAYLTDGNAILTIERMTGPTPRIEIYPRDPRLVDINTNTRAYRFGKYTANQRVYKRSDVIHIRDMSVGDPYWGIGRVNTVRDEIMMDYFVNRFNANFFKNGATLNLMFTPEFTLTEDQHEQIIDAMKADIEGADNAFKIFINRFAGKYEYPDQKHKDISFLELLKSNREKIFGVFGLPPFRGGVMEYANYANALAQDQDFWNNTIKPILKVIEDAINKQLLWPLFGEDIQIQFDLSDVPALKGDETEIVSRLLQLKNGGIVSAKYVREQLGIDENAAPEEAAPQVASKEAAPQVAPNDNTPDNNEEDSNEPTNEEQNEIGTIVYRLLKQHRSDTLVNFHALTLGGEVMSVLCDPEGQSEKIYNIVTAEKTLKSELLPRLEQILVKRGVKAFTGKGVFDTRNDKLKTVVENVRLSIADAVEQQRSMIESVLYTADRYNWTYRQTEKEIRRTFTCQQASRIATVVLRELLSNGSRAIGDMQLKSALNTVGAK